MKNLKFSDVAEFISDKVELSNLQKEQYISTENMLPNYGGIVEIDKLPKIEKCNKFKQGDILFSNIRTYFKKVWVAEFSGGCSPDVLIIRSKDENIVRTSYLYLLICSDDFINFTVASSNGAKMPRGDKNAIKNYIFNIPDIAFQDKAINTYFRFNKKITLNTQTNQTLEQIAQGIFKHWFIDFAPVHAKAEALARGETTEQAELAAMACLSGKTTEKITALKTQDPTAYHQLQQTAAAFPSEFVETEMGQVPKGWERTTLTHICEMKNGYAFKSKEWTDEGIPVIKIGSVKPMLIELDNGSFVAAENETLRADFLASEGDILVGLTGYVGEVGRIPYQEKAMINQRVAKFMPKKITETMNYYCFIYCLARQKEFKAFTEMNAKGSAQANISTKEILSYPVIIATKEIHIAFENTVKNLLDKIIVNSGENSTLAKTRDELLPRLLSGEIEL
ncbi:restriction endonuclease subunit S [Avibacterium paragallinarum]|uniref:restriction endonuclease subunit S n=1 Tax=Avibacterium paragallinarum TaxID=728 RepID=UPI0021F7B69C|nr:restriction endonuclease subunit S [Avibacterium paragallinarum]UXN34901.1 restriction endonuclease subunit S [Avibacterium paragallinarum]